MRLAFTLGHHDHAYVERRGGWELLTHLRGADARATYRRGAIQRAWERFVEAEKAGLDEPHVGGLGLLVLQRALLATEDLGGLLHAYADEDPWTRLRTAQLTELDHAFERAAYDTETVLGEAFRLPGGDELAAEGLADVEVMALGRLRDRVVVRWRRMLIRCADLWLTHRMIAKATVHGFPFVAGHHVHGPPPAGELAEGLAASCYGRYAVAITSSVRGEHVTTTRTPVRLDREAVDRYRRDGRSSARLYRELCELQAGSIVSGHKRVIPLLSLPRLSRDDQALIQAAQERMTGEEDEQA